MDPCADDFAPERCLTILGCSAPDTPKCTLQGLAAERLKEELEHEQNYAISLQQELEV